MRSTSLYKGFQPQAAHRQDHPGQIRHTDHWPLLGTLAHLSEARRSPSGICEPHAQGARSPVDLLVPGTNLWASTGHMLQELWCIRRKENDFCTLLLADFFNILHRHPFNLCLEISANMSGLLPLHTFITCSSAMFWLIFLCNCYAPIVFSRYRH